MLFALYHYVSKLPQSMYRVVANSGKFPYQQSQYKVKDFIPFPCHVNCKVELCKRRATALKLKYHSRGYFSQPHSQVFPLSSFWSIGVCKNRRTSPFITWVTPSHLGRQRGKRHVWPISCPSSCTIALQANYKPNCQVYMLYRDSLQMWFHYVSILIFRMLTLKQAKSGNHCHMKVWQNAAMNITPLSSEPNYHTLEEMWILILVILFGIRPW